MIRIEDKRETKFGMEYESSPEKVNKLLEVLRKRTHRDYSIGESEENRFIHELQLPPKRMMNFLNFLRYYLLVSKVDKFEYVEGSDDVCAGGLHVHLSGDIYESFLQNIDIMGEAQERFVVISNRFFSKRGDYLRSSIDYRCDFTTHLEDKILEDSKSFFLTKKEDFNTIEFRINENPLPLWIYLMPLFVDDESPFSEELRRKISNKMDEDGLSRDILTIDEECRGLDYCIEFEEYEVYDCDDCSFYKENQEIYEATNLEKELGEEALTEIKALFPALVEMWVESGISAPATFRKVMEIFKRNDFVSFECYDEIHNLMYEIDSLYKESYDELVN